MASQVFRAGVVLVVRHPTDDLVMAFERVDAPGAWQLPQGGIHAGEEPVDAAWRELAEETGLTAMDVELRGEHPEWTVYEWPEEFRRAEALRGRRQGDRRGQVQRWFVFVARSTDVKATPDGREFGAWRWVEAAWLVDHVVEFRRASYRHVLAAAGLVGP